MAYDKILNAGFVKILIVNSLHYIFQVNVSPSIFTSKLRVSLKTGSRVLTFAEKVKYENVHKYANICIICN